MPNTCLVTLVTDETIKIKPGRVNLKLVPKTGSVFFDSKETDVTDGDGNKVPAVCDPQSVSFTAEAGKRYHLDLLHLAQPVDATADLVEDCPKQTVIDTISFGGTWTRYEFLCEQGEL